jgi:hypothetical protein
VALVLLDDDRRGADVHLLDDTRWPVQRLCGIPTIAAGSQSVVEGAAVDLLRGEGGALVPGVARPAAAPAFVLVWWRAGLGRLDDVGGRGLRRGRVTPRELLRSEITSAGWQILQPAW